MKFLWRFVDDFRVKDEIIVVKRSPEKRKKGGVLVENGRRSQEKGEFFLQIPGRLHEKRGNNCGGTS
ncbi:unnamed protein product, partial [Didymodactylos carnosus]